MATARLTGVPELDRMLKNLAVPIADKASAAALRSGVTFMARDMRSRAPKAKTQGHSTDEFKKAIKGTVRKPRKSGIIESKAGIAVGAKVKRRNWQVFHLLALGTADRYSGRKRVRGWVMVDGKRKRKWLNKYKQTGNARIFRGRMIYNSFIRVSANATYKQAVVLMQKKAKQVIATEVAKRNRGTP